MAKSDSWRPRLNIDITEEQYFKLQKLFPWGVQQAFWRCIVDDVIEVVEKKGELAIAVVLDRALRFKEMSKTLRQLEDLPDGHPQRPSSEVDLGNDDRGTPRTSPPDPSLQEDS